MPAVTYGSPALDGEVNANVFYFKIFSKNYLNYCFFLVNILKKTFNTFFENVNFVGKKTK